jgi:hypothetical protein
MIDPEMVSGIETAWLHFFRLEVCGYDMMTIGVRAGLTMTEVARAVRPVNLARRLFIVISSYVRA